MDRNDPGLYDLILNLEKISVDTAAKNIAEMARSEDILACSLSALESMERLSLERKIHAQLLEHVMASNIFSVEIKEPGTVAIYGIAGSEDEKARILKTVSDMEEVKKIESNLVVAIQGL